MEPWRPRRVLVGYDHSPAAADAVALTRLLIEADAEVVLANVLPSPSTLPGSIRLLRRHEWPDPEGFFDAALAALPDHVVECRTYSGSPAGVLDEVAQAGRFELVCVGAPHGHGLTKRVGAGVSQALLHGAPVLTGSAPAGFAHSAQRLERVAVAFDGSIEAVAALRRAEALALAFGASLLLLTVDSRHEPIEDFHSYELDLPDGRKLMGAALADVDPRLDVDGKLLRGDAADVLVEACGRSADLLFAGSRGYGPAARVLLGSVSTQLLFRCPCPLLIEPRPHPARAPGQAGSAPFVSAALEAEHRP